MAFVYLNEERVFDRLIVAYLAHDFFDLPEPTLALFLTAGENQFSS